VADAAYFVAWLERVIADTRANADFNSALEKQATLEYLESAQARFRSLATATGSQP
jgi:hypothetical protein